MRQNTRFAKKIELSKALDANFLFNLTSYEGNAITSKESIHRSLNGFDIVTAKEGRGANSSACGDNTKKGRWFGLINICWQTYCCTKVTSQG